MPEKEVITLIDRIRSKSWIVTVQTFHDQQLKIVINKLKERPMFMKKTLFTLPTNTFNLMSTMTNQNITLLANSDDYTFCNELIIGTDVDHISEYSFFLI